MKKVKNTHYIVITLDSFSHNNNLKTRGNNIYNFYFNAISLIFFYRNKKIDDFLALT